MPLPCSLVSLLYFKHFATEKIAGRLLMTATVSIRQEVPSVTVPCVTYGIAF